MTEFLAYDLQAFLQCEPLQCQLIHSLLGVPMSKPVRPVGPSQHILACRAERIRKGFSRYKIVLQGVPDSSIINYSRLVQATSFKVRRQIPVQYDLSHKAALAYHGVDHTVATGKTISGPGAMPGRCSQLSKRKGMQLVCTQPGTVADAGRQCASGRKVAGNQLQLLGSIGAGTFGQTVSASRPGSDPRQNYVRTGRLMKKELDGLTISVKGFLPHFMRSLEQVVAARCHIRTLEITETVFLQPGTKHSEACAACVGRADRMNLAVTAIAVSGGTECESASNDVPSLISGRPVTDSSLAAGHTGHCRKVRSVVEAALPADS